jgi:hypothetical protein
MSLTKTYKSKLSALEYYDFIKPYHKNKDIRIFRDLYEYTTYVVGVLVDIENDAFILEDATRLSRKQYTFAR